MTPVVWVAEIHSRCPEEAIYGHLVRAVGIKLSWADGRTDLARLEFIDGATYINGDRYFVTPRTHTADVDRGGWSGRRSNSKEYLNDPTKGQEMSSSRSTRIGDAPGMELALHQVSRRQEY